MVYGCRWDGFKGLQRAGAAILAEIRLTSVLSLKARGLALRPSTFLPVSGIAASKTNQATTPTVERAKKVALYPVLTTRKPAAALLSEPAIPCTVPSTPRAAL